MKIDIYDIGNYNIQNIINLKTKCNNEVYNSVFDSVNGDWYLKVINHNSKLSTINFYIPEYASFSYESQNLITNNNLNYCDITHDNIISIDNLKSVKHHKFLSTFKDGFRISSKMIEIHPSYYFNKLVGLLILS